SPTERRLENSEYKNFYVDGQKLFCEFCKHVIDHTKKSTLDSHLKSDKHKNNVIKAEKLKSSRQTTLDTTSNILNDHERINIALVKAFTNANISLEKVDQLKKSP
ncbi:24492_t:CDS:2, partial [Racocetra persica]